MSYWDDRLKNHPIHATLTETIQKLNSAEAFIESIEYEEQFRRLRNVTNYLKNELDASDPEMMSLECLERIHGYLTTMNNRLNNFLNNKQIGPLKNSNGDLDHIINELTGLSVIKIPFGMEEVGKDISASRQRLSNIVVSLENRVNDVIKESENRLEEFKNKTESISNNLHKLTDQIKNQENFISEQKRHLDNITSQYQTQFTDNQAKRETEFHDKLTQQEEQLKSLRESIENRLNEFINKQQENFNQKNSSFTQQINEQLQSLKQEVSKRTNDLDEKARTLLSNLESKELDFFSKQENEAKGRIIYLDEQAKKAEDLVKLVSDITITGNYANIATEERKIANLLRWISFGLMFSMAALAFLTVYLFVKAGGFDWEIALFRIISIGIVAIPAFYLAGESEKHRRNEQRNRKFQLELTAVDPYLQNLEPNDQKEIKKKLADHFFAQPEPISEKEDGVKSKNIFNLFEFLVKELVKRIK